MNDFDIRETPLSYEKWKLLQMMKCYKNSHIEIDSRNSSFVSFFSYRRVIF